MRITRVHSAIHRLTVPYGEGGVVFLYVVKGDRVALIDTGTAQSPQDFIQPALHEIGLSLADVDLILNTHAHMDHAGGNAEAKRASNAPIYVHAGDWALATSAEAQVQEMTEPLRRLHLPEQAVQLRADFVRRMAGNPAGVDVLLADGDMVDLGAGLKLKVIHNPGHSPGSVSFYWESEGVLLTGDAVQGQGLRPGDTSFYTNASDYRRSLAALTALDVNLLCMGHGFFVRGLPTEPTQTGADVKAFFSEAIDLADNIHRAVVGAMAQMPTAGEREIARAAIAELAYDYPLHLSRETHLPRSAGPTILAHIDAAKAGTYPSPRWV